MNTNKPKLRSVLVLAACLCIVPHCVASADESPAAEHIASPSDVLAGKLNAVNSQLDATIDNLQAARLKEFAGSYRSLTTAYVSAAEEVQAAFKSASFALARIQFTRQVIAQSPAAGERSTDRSLDGVRELRAALLQDLDNARTAFAEAKSTDEGRQHLGRISLAVERIEQLDALLGTDESKRPAVKLSDLSRPLALLETELQTEQRHLEVQAVALSGLLRDLMSQVDQSLKVLELDSTLPYDQLAELQRVRRGVHQLVGKILDTRRNTSALVAEAFSRRPTTAVADSKQLLDRAKSLLQASQTGLSE